MYNSNNPAGKNFKKSPDRKPPARLLVRNALTMNTNKPSMRTAAKNIKQSVVPQSAKSILAMIRKLPNKMVQQIYKGLESLEPDDLDMLGKKKYPGE
jgi:hypothetical protein